MNRIWPITTTSGEANIDLCDVSAMVRNKAGLSVDIHMCGGTIFTSMDVPDREYSKLLSLWRLEKTMTHTQDVAVSFDEVLTVRRD